MAALVPVPVRLVAPGWEQRVPSPAIDSLEPSERRRFIEDNPDSYLTVTRSPDDVEPGEVWNAEAALAASKAALRRLLDRGAFTPPRRPALYLYRLTDGDHRQLGIVGGVSVDDYDRGVVRIHEQVKPPRAQHLADQLGGLGVQSSPITLAHRPNAALTEIVRPIADHNRPAVEMTADDGLHQEIWEVVDVDVVAAVQSALAGEALYLIDGHHRAAAASTHRAEVTDAEGGAGLDLMLSAVFPITELKSESFHRWLHHDDPAVLLAELEAVAAIRPAADLDAVLSRRTDELALWTGGRWHLVSAPPGEEGGHSPGTAEWSIARLDPVRLDRRILGPVLGIDQTGASDRLRYLHGMADRDDLMRIESVHRGAVWALRPVPMDALLAVSDAGLTMPPKSTYFVPKVRSGVFLRSLDGAPGLVSSGEGG